jgi:uncharacterized protein YqfA (UPF0365 family)
MASKEIPPSPFLLEGFRCALQGEGGVKILVVQRLVRALLELEHHRSGLQGNKTVKLALRELNASNRTGSAEVQSLLERPVRRKQQKSDGALKNKKAFEALSGIVAAMAMGANVGARLEHVQETLNRILLLMQVEIAAEARAQQGLISQPIKQRLIKGAQLG